jgi:hypothetical protein
MASQFRKALERMGKAERDAAAVDPMLTIGHLIHLAWCELHGGNFAHTPAKERARLALDEAAQAVKALTRLGVAE